VNHAAENKDTLRIVSTFQGGGQDYDPAAMDADLSLGQFALHIPQGTLVKNKANVAKGKVPIGSGSVQVSLDLKRHICMVNGSKLELNGEIDRTMATAFDVGSFDQWRSADGETIDQEAEGNADLLGYATASLVEVAGRACGRRCRARDWSNH